VNCQAKFAMCLCFEKISVDQLFSFKQIFLPAGQTHNNMAFSIWHIFQFALLLVNALAVLNEERFLRRSTSQRHMVDCH